MCKRRSRRSTSAPPPNASSCRITIIPSLEADFRSARKSLGEPVGRWPTRRQPDSSHAHGGSGHYGHASIHEHRAGHKAWADIRADLSGSGLDADVKKHALAIFELLAEAEAKVHGVAVDSVTFHEVGAVDSIVDIVAAAQLISLIAPIAGRRRHCRSDSGRINAAHGVLPVPAPAAALLLQGLPVIDDGVPGERVTPTGAALARLPHRGRARRQAGGFAGYRAAASDLAPELCQASAIVCACWRSTKRRRTAAGPIGRRQLAVATFEVDDQCPEDLATGLDHVRALPGVFDVTQNSVAGKKGRVAAHVQVLVAPRELENVIVACFEETTTIGLRYQLTEGALLRRRLETVEIEGERLQVKIVDRPGGARSGKAEAADVASHRGHAARARLRREAVALALDRTDRSWNGAADDAEGGL